MKNLIKLFSIFSITVVPSTSTSMIVDEISQTNQEVIRNDLLGNEINSMDDYSTSVLVNLSDKVKTKALGTSVRESRGNTSTAISNQTWEDDFENTSIVTAHGFFNYGTYKNGKKKNDISLRVKDFSTNRMVWEDDDTVESWTGWGHHTSRIRLTVEAINMPYSGIIQINVDYFIYARTAGAVHSCVTEIVLNRLFFPTK